jgi:hypothetical protein
MCNNSFRTEKNVCIVIKTLQQKEILFPGWKVRAKAQPLIKSNFMSLDEVPRRNNLNRGTPQHP